VDPANLLTEVLVFVGLLFLSAFFSGSETAFFSLSKAQLRELKELPDNTAKRVISLLDRPRELLVAILIGNTVVNTAAASVAAIAVNRMAIAAGFNSNVALVLQIVAVTFVLIVVVEISPKVFALKHNRAWALKLASAIRFSMILMRPFTWMLVHFVEGIAKLFKVEATRVLFSEEELRTLAEVSEEHGVLEEEEKEMIHSIFEFGETEVHEIMVPRIDMAAIGKDSSITEAAALVKERGHSRIPVYEHDIDHIVGVLYAKDLIGKISGEKKNDPIEKHIREAFFVPENKKISSLLKDFQKDKIHMAIVVDEYGGTEGLVTMEDVIEEIVGDIHDEFDTEEILFKRLENGDYHVQAKMEVEEFNGMINEDVVPEEEDYESLGGFIFSLAEEVPSEGKLYKHKGWTFKVTAVEDNRVVSLRVKAPDDINDVKNKNESRGAGN